MATKSTRRYAEAGRRTAEAQRQIQEKSAKGGAGKAAKGAKAARTGAAAKRAMQPAGRKYPEPPLPRQHQRKPGIEQELEPRPQFEAPGYRGSGKLEGKVALITGGDSGIGRAVAVLYAREGAHVAIVYLDEDQDAEETRRVVEAEGARALLIPGDVSNSQFCRYAVEQTLEAFDRLDILVNNAAFQESADSIEQISDEQWDLTFRTNIYGYFYMARAALPHLSPGSVILNTGSVTAIEGSSHLLDYSATKGAIHTFTKSLSQSVLDRGIRVNCVAPGPVWTPLNPSDAEPARVARFGSSVPMARPAQPEEVAPAFVFLASAVDSSYITGEVLPVLGGETVSA
jgi:NAD(P)-dependent dehydrogenase (short-subunit alcohol dehydrogenase family)